MPTYYIILHITEAEGIEQNCANWLEFLYFSKLSYINSCKVYAMHIELKRLNKHKCPMKNIVKFDTFKILNVHTVINVKLIMLGTGRGRSIWAWPFSACQARPQGYEL